jgi:hypothetical protein
MKITVNYFANKPPPDKASLVVDQPLEEPPIFQVKCAGGLNGIMPDKIQRE